MNQPTYASVLSDRVHALALIVITAMILPSAVSADGTEMLDTPSIPIASGTGITAAGVGLGDAQPGDIVVDVPDGAAVQQVILYWEGTNLATADLTPADTILVDGGPVEGVFIGGDTLFSGTDGNGERTVAYRADITGLGLVGDGISTISVGGLDFTEENDGAGVLVVYDDGSPESGIDVRDGNDFAFKFRPNPLNVTELQTFAFDPSDQDRIGSVNMLVGSVADDTGNYGFRPSSFEITTGGSPAVFSDQLNSMDGRYWDTVNLVVTVPAGATELSAQIFSRDDEVVAPGNLPASLVWVAAGFSVETPPPGSCWITTGGFHNSGEASGSKDYTFGGNVGPPPRGSWEVVDHNTGDNFHSNDVHIVSCDVIRLTGPGQPGGKKGFKINQATFEGTGRLNGVHGYPFTGFVQDAGEPQGKKTNDSDFFSITVRDPVTNAIVFEASATLDGGNVQIHPPTGGKN
jgi:hypothetical protein